MGTLIKSSSEVFNDHVLELTRVLHGYRHFSSSIKRRFNKLGYKIVTSGNHIKCYYNDYFVTTIAATPSDAYAGHQVLRYIRSFWESYEKNSTFDRS